MFIYACNKYNKAKYSKGFPAHKQGHLYYGSCIVGIEVRKQIGHKWIYRRRPGNGYANAKRGKTYQDRFTYFVPSTIMHPNGDASRACFANAVTAWAGLSEAEKQTWNEKGERYKRIPGRNYFFGEYMKENY